MEDGAAADMVWSRGEARMYMGMLDVERGGRVVGTAEEAWPAYGEAVRDRKWYVTGLARGHVEAAGSGQVVVLGAGLDALPLEIAARSGHPVASY